MTPCLASVAPAGPGSVEGRRVQSAAPRVSSIACRTATLLTMCRYDQLSPTALAPGNRLRRDGRFAMRLLIIEDDRDAADYLVKAFREVGHVADHAADGEEGLALALDGQYDVLIVDRMLPKRDGLSVIGDAARQGHRDAGADPVGARPGRRPRQGPARRRRRLSAQALFVLRTARPRRSAGAPPRRPARRRSIASATSSSTGCRTG